MWLYIAKNQETRRDIMSLTLTSTAFEDSGEIPSRFTCDGDDLSPDLSWTGFPEGTRSLVLIVDDPDAPDPTAPRMVWDHWLLYNLPPMSGGLPEAVTPEGLPAGTLQGTNSWGRTGYGGPCPPIGRHRYFHILYAVDIQLPDLGQPNKNLLLEAMEGHILERTQLVGTYKKQD
jgi:Raf kinase inhibitor-like YbhB/YbcL family protein